MSELDRLKRAMEQMPVVPRAEAKRAAIAAALQAFDMQAHRARQGIAAPGRLRSAASAAYRLLTGKTSMRTTHALAGGASLLVLALAVMSAANLQYLDMLPKRGGEVASPGPASEAPVEQKAKADASVAQRTEAEARSDAASLPYAPPPAPDALQGAEAPAGAQPQREAAASAPAELASRTAALDALQPMPAPSLAEPAPPPAYRDQGRDRFADIDTNPLKVTAEEPVSTFSADVDTASYSFMRASLNNGVLPQADAVRVEELINYFPYDYPGPDTRDEPFRASVSVLPTPWNGATKLVHIGIRGYDVAPAEQRKANLVFLVDTSGSMNEPNKLPLLVNSLKLLVDGLRPEDRVAIVAYAGAAGTVLEPTPASEKGKIVAALENLMAGGSTAGGEGIRQAYGLAERSLVPDGVNRVILATDGDFNVGITDTEELKGFVERQRQTGIYLSVLGFGMGNYNDELMQALAQNGNGAAAYIDTLNEARKVLVEEAGSTMFPIAEDVKFQVEFNPATVAEYRLIGYETRMLAREDFNNDRVDAGEIGSGHTVTAIYEITPAGGGGRLVDDLRYGAQNAAPAAGGAGGGEFGFLKIRYKLPGEEASRIIETPITPAQELPAGAAAGEAQFAAAVAAFGQILRGGQYTGAFGYDDVIALAEAAKGLDEFGYRAEFLNLVRLAKSAAALERQQP